MIAISAARDGFAASAAPPPRNPSAKISALATSWNPGGASARLGSFILGKLVACRLDTSCCQATLDRRRPLQVRQPSISAPEQAAICLFAPGGLRTGSPPSPPPRLIRPTVRRLPRSPRLWVRVPNTPDSPSCYSSSSGLSRFHACDLLELCQDLCVVLSQEFQDAGIA
jgi:hypothetical protein